MEGMRPAIYLVVPLPFSVPLDGECIGVEECSVISGEVVIVATPQIHHREDGSIYLSAPDTPGLRDDVDWSRWLDSPFPWGSPIAWKAENSLGKGDTASVSALLARLQAVPPSDSEERNALGSRLQADSLRWAHLLGDWLEVAAGSCYGGRTGMVPRYFG